MRWLLLEGADVGTGNTYYNVSRYVQVARALSGDVKALCGLTLRATLGVRVGQVTITHKITCTFNKH